MDLTSKTVFHAYVYGLRFTKDGHPFTGLIRYVGKSLTPQHRFVEHMNEKYAHGRVARSVRKNGSAAFSLEILETISAPTRFEADASAYATERQYIAKLNTAHGEHGLNLTEGGEGFNLVGEALEKHRIQSSKIMREVQGRPEVRAKCALLRTQRLADPKNKAAILDKITRARNSPQWKIAMKKRHSDPVQQQKLSEAFKKLNSDPVFKQARAERNRKRNQDPEYRAKVSAGLVRRYMLHPEFREQKAAVARTQHQDPEFEKKYREGLRRKHSDPVYAAQHSSFSKIRHKNPALTLSAKIGIALHWAEKHRTIGNTEKMFYQIQTLSVLLEQALEYPEDSNLTKVRVDGLDYLSKHGHQDFVLQNNNQGEQHGSTTTTT